MITIYFDGLCQPTNPGGFACWAYYAVDEDGKTIAQNYGCVGHGEGMTNNVAEHTACCEALKRALAEGWIGVELRGDSQLVVNQVNGDWSCNQSHLLPMLKQSMVMMQSLNATLLWVPREQNKRADHLSNVAYNKAKVMA